MFGIDWTAVFSPEVLENVVAPFLLTAGAKALRFVLILAAAFVLARISGRVLARLVRTVMKEEETGDGLARVERRKRIETLEAAARRLASIVVWALAFVMALSELGYDIGPLLAGAGVAGIAIGFGAQNLVRDFLAGFFFLLENQIRVGDVTVINGTGGLVEQLNLRTTVLRDLRGVVHVFPNGKIDTLANLTRDYSYWVFEIGVAYTEDVDRVADVLRRIGMELREDDDFKGKILADIEVFGLDKFADSALIIKGRIKTVPLEQWAVGRELNRRVKIRFDREGIEIPFPQRTLSFGNSLPTGDSALKSAVEEQLRERGAAPRKIDSASAET